MSGLVAGGQPAAQGDLGTGGAVDLAKLGGRDVVGVGDGEVVVRRLGR